MWRSSFGVGACILGAAVLWGCSTGPDFMVREEPWRRTEEQACVSAGRVRESPFIHMRQALGGPSVCGAEHPFEMTASSDGRISLRPAALLRCQMVPAVDHWLYSVVEPAARQHFGAGLVEIKVAASYGCRPMNNQSGGFLSEHGFANALDVSTFVLADGRAVTVKQGWSGSSEERAFLRDVHSGACRTFTTVLGPDANSYHHDHFHVDLARRGRDGAGRYCK